MRYCIIINRSPRLENRNPELHGPYNSFRSAMSACKAFVETTSGELTDQEYANLVELKETFFEYSSNIADPLILCGNGGEYSLQIAELKSRLILLDCFSHFKLRDQNDRTLKTAGEWK